MSAPIMYLAARMVLIQYATLDQYSNIISTTRQDVSIIAIISLVRRRNEEEKRGEGKEGRRKEGNFKEKEGEERGVREVGEGRGGEDRETK